MHKHILLVLAIVCLSYENVTAQTFEGKVVTQNEMVMETSSPASSKMNEPMMTTSWIKNDRMRMEMKSPFMGEMVVITDYIKKESVTLMNMMGKKMAIVSSLDEAGAHSAAGSTPKLPENMTCKETGKSKTILGYTCHETQCNYTSQDGKSGQMNAWYCKDFAPNRNIHSGFSGMPFEYSMITGGMTMKVSTIEISKESISDELFIIPADYTVTTAEDMMKTMHGK